MILRSLLHQRCAKTFTRAACALVVSLAMAACNDASAPDLAGAVIKIVPVVGSVFEGDTIQLAAQVFDEAGAADTTTPVTWTVNDTTLAELVGDGIFALRQPGTVRITARSDTLAATYDLVIGRLVVQRVELTPETIDMGRTDHVAVAARVLGQGDRVMTGRPVTFTSDDTLVAIFAGPTSIGSTTTGVFVAVGPGSTTVRASVDGVTGTAHVGVVVADTTFTLTEYEDSPIPVLVLADTAVIDGGMVFNEVLADSGTLVLSGLLQERYQLDVFYSVYRVTQVGNTVDREFRFRLRAEFDRGLVTVRSNGSLSMVSEIIGPHLEHTGTPQSDGYLVGYRIAGTSTILDLRYGRVTPLEGPR